MKNFNEAIKIYWAKGKRNKEAHNTEYINEIERHTTQDI